MKLFTTHEVTEEPDTVFYDYDDEEQLFKPFYKTYKMITFAMVTCMVYPNPRLDAFRIKYILIIFISISPLSVMISVDIYYSWMEKDIVNIIRHSTVLGPFLAGFLKIILMHLKRNQGAEILKEFHRDYNLYNHFKEEYKVIAEAGVKNSLIYIERGWVVVVLVCVLIFPSMAIVLNLYNFMFKFEATKYMIHDLNIPFAKPEARFSSPYFEVMFVYETYCSMLYVIMFIGYDAFYGLSINHACMKIQLYCNALESTFRGGKNVRTMVIEVIREQCRLYEFVDRIQDTFNIWLGLVFLATMVQICSCLYHITEGFGFDLRYMIFVTGAVIHVYLPCRYAAKLKAVSMESASLIYSSGWELVNDQEVRAMVVFMIARAQRPVEIIALDMITFDMELFVSILQTSYSMYTLLRS